MAKKYLSFYHFIAAVDTLFDGGNREEAFALLYADGPLFDEHYQWRVVHHALRLHGRMGDVEGAIETLNDAMDEGLWFSKTWLNADTEDFKSLFKSEDFSALAEESWEIQQEAAEEAIAEMWALLPTDDVENPPLLVALHGNYSSAIDDQAYWEEITDHGVMLVMPESSQIDGPEAYVWSNFEIAEYELKEHFATIQAGYEFNEDAVILAGFSMGAGFAAYATIKGLIPANGLILVAPYIPDVQTLIESLDADHNSNLRTYIIIGEEDAGCLPAARELSAAMEERGMDVQLDLRANYAHTYPEEFSETLVKAVAFVLNQ